MSWRDVLRKDKRVGMSDQDSTRQFRPRFDAAGLVTAVVTDRAGALLMVAHMNDAAIAATRATGRATFWSRSRGRLWMKGETSGHVLNVLEMRVDCDQDALWIIADPAGPACHTGAPSCFYRRVTDDGLVPVE
jgi:phosphoribosyl-AMP cyclohydrolase